MRVLKGFPAGPCYGPLFDSGGSVLWGPYVGSLRGLWSVLGMYDAAEHDLDCRRQDSGVCIRKPWTGDPQSSYLYRAFLARDVLLAGCSRPLLGCPGPWKPLLLRPVNIEDGRAILSIDLL